MKKIGLILTLALLSSGIFSQITVNVSPNPNPDLSAWADRQETVTVTVNNPGQPVTVKFNSQLKLNGQVKARTKFAQMPSVYLDRGINVFSAEDIVPYNAVELFDVNKRAIARTGQLPGGNYQLCISLVDEKNQPVNRFPERCANFLISQIQPPILILPTDNQHLNSDRPVFNWTPISPIPNGVRISYRLMVFEILKGQNPIQATKSNQPVLDITVAGVSSPWPPEWDLPSANRQYVWTVQAVDDNDKPIGENNGLATPQTFITPDNQQKIGDSEPWSQCATYVCFSKGIKVVLFVPSDAMTTGSTSYKVSAYSIPIKYYATASQVIAEFGSTGASEVDDWIGYISSSNSAKYCDKNGFPIVNQVVYEVTKTNPINYNGYTNVLHASGACFDYNNFTALANHYNSYNNSFLDVPNTCTDGCLEGGSNPDTPFGGSGATNAANETIDDITLDPTGGSSSGGGVTPTTGKPGKLDNNNQNKAANGDGWVQCVNFTCKIKGAQVGIYVPDDAATTGSTSYKVLAYSTNISYYATASQVIAEFGSTGASEVDDWIGYVSSGSSMKYCDKNGFPIVDQTVYTVTKTNPNNYNGNTNVLHASGVCSDYNNYTNLANHYNSYNNSFTDIPTSCSEGCLEGGSNPDNPTGGSNPTNAANEEIDDITLDPIDENGNGGIKPGGGLPNIGATPANLANGIWVDNGGGNFQVYQKKKEYKSGNYCSCNGNLCTIDNGKCSCCGEQPKEIVSTCDCEVNGQKVSLIAKDNCRSSCKELNKKFKAKR